jgi:hypothetical protein
MDKGRTVDNLYLVNGHFHESLSSLSNKADNFLERMRIIFRDEPKKHKITNLRSLEFLIIAFQSEWPLEIILDKESIMQYNAILSFLMKIKRVNYVLTQKDYWIRDKVYNKPFDRMNVRE